MLHLAQTTGFPVSFFLEAAAAIGAGVIVGSFVGATAGVFYGWSRKQVEGSTLRDGYFGAAGVTGVWLFKSCIVYATQLWAA